MELAERQVARQQADAALAAERPGEGGWLRGLERRRARHVVQQGQVDTGFLQAITDRRRGKARGVFHAIEALFFDGGNQLAVANEGGRSVAVVRIDPENVHLRIIQCT